MSLNVTIEAEQLNPQPNPTPVIPADAPNSSTNWNTFTAPPTTPSVPSSTLANPGTVASPSTGSPVTAPSTADPALIITTADARPNFEWPDGSWRSVPYSQVQTTENLFYGTGSLYKNAGGFGGPFTNPGTNPPSPFNPPVGLH